MLNVSFASNGMMERTVGSSECFESLTVRLAKDEWNLPKEKYAKTFRSKLFKFFFPPHSLPLTTPDLVFVVGSALQMAMAKHGFSRNDADMIRIKFLRND